MGKDRISRKAVEFNLYITRTDNYQKEVDPITNLANWERLTLTQQNSADWTGHRKDWDKLFKKYCNPDTSTSIVKANVRTFIDDFRAFANPLLNKMASCGVANTEDEAEFNFKTTRKQRTRRTESISTQCFTRIKVLGGGMIKFHCYDDSTASRAKLTGGADGVMIYYSVIDPVDLAANTRSADVDKPVSPIKSPGSTSACQRQIMYSGASFILALGDENVGKRLFYFIGWYNSKHPELAGPVSGPFMMVIS
jgi:hypothetical protein